MVKQTAWAALQRALYQRLQGLPCPVFDDVPQGQAFPYAVIGEDVTSDDDTKLDYGEELSTTIHVWSRAHGYSEVKELCNRVIAAVTANPLILAGFQFGIVLFEFGQVSREPDGQTRHGVLRFRFKIYQEA